MFLCFLLIFWIQIYRKVQNVHIPTCGKINYEKIIIICGFFYLTKITLVGICLKGNRLSCCDVDSPRFLTTERRNFIDYFGRCSTEQFLHSTHKQCNEISIEFCSRFKLTNFFIIIFDFFQSK